MKSISLETSDSNLDIKYGMYDLTQGLEPSPLALSSFKYIGTDITEIKTKYIRLGFHLYECKKCKYYEHFGYLTLEEFVDANFGMDKSAVSRCINVFERFCRRGGSYGNFPTMFIDDKYSDYSYSQLCEMLPLSDDDIRLIKPSMSVSTIREMKKSKKNLEKVATSQLQEDSLLFDIKKFGSLHGAVRSSYVKNNFSDTESVIIQIFDKDGTPIFEFNGTWCDLLGIGKYDKDGGKNIVIRMT